MSVAGIDFGNLNFLIAQAGKGGVDVILNGASNRQTAVAVSIQGKQRFIGDAGAAMARSNVTNTLTNMKMLVGRAYDNPDVQKELANCPFKTVKMEHGGVGVVINYNSTDITIPVEHAMAMVLVLAKETSAKAAQGINLADGLVRLVH
jgi:heat shock protein 4